MSRRRLAPLLLFLLLPLAAPGALSIYLKGVAHLEADTYTLGDIASVPAGEQQAAAALLRTPLGRAPRRPALLAAQSVGELLAEAGYTQVVLVGGRVVLLPRQSVPAAAERFYADLLAFLGNTDGVASGRIEVETLQLGAIPASASYGFALAGSPTPRAAGAAGSAAALLTGELLLSYGLEGPPGAASAGAAAGGTVRLWVHRFLPVAYTAVSIPVRTSLEGGRVVYREEDVSLSAQAFLTRTDGVESFRSAVGLPAGARIEPRHLERALAVRAGDPVRVVFLRPGLRVSVPGRAAGSGAVGDRVEVRLSAGGRRFDGLIAAGGEVCVEGF